MSRELICTLTLIFDDSGRLDREAIEANLNQWMQQGVSEGIITPDDEDHTALTAWDITPGTPPAPSADADLLAALEFYANAEAWKDVDSGIGSCPGDAIDYGVTARAAIAKAEGKA